MASSSAAAAAIDIPGIDLGAELGRGAHSVVFSARREDTELAVKVAIDSDISSRDKEHARFLREATLLASLRHPAFAEIYEIGEISGRAYLVMERIAGHSMAEFLQDRRPTPERLTDLIIDVARGLAAIHRRGLVHRDVKPRNVLIDQNGTARLMDFGLVTRSGEGIEWEISGTFSYSAPEQTGLLKRPIDGRADLYALGVVLYEGLSGHLPFYAEDPGELMRLHAVETPTPLTEAVPGCDPVLAAIADRLLAKDPDDRYQTAEGLLSDLSRLGDLRREYDLRGELHLRRDDYEYGVLRETPLVGREPEMRALKRAWEQCRRGTGCAVLVSGSAGSGKTRALHELLGTVRETGGLVVLTRCREHDRPFGAMNGAVTALLDHLARLPRESSASLKSLVAEAAAGFEDVLAHSLPRLRAALDLPLGDPATASERYFEAFASFVLRLARAAGGLALFVDDVDAIDDASAKVLERVAARVRELPFLLVATCADASDSIQRANAVLEGDGATVRRVDTRPLDLDSVERLLCAYLGVKRVGHELVQQMMVRTEGSPLLISEYMRAMLEGGMLLPSWGDWLVNHERLERLTLSNPILQLVQQRIDHLDDEAVRVLRAAAVLGTHFDLEIVAKMSDSDHDTVTWAVAEALRARLVERDGSGRYAFIHQQVRGAFLRYLDSATESQLHRAAARVLAKLPTVSDDSVFALARHETLGDGPRVYETNLEAGRLAMERHAYDRAVEYFDRARHEEPDTAAENHELWEQLGVATARTGRADAAIGHLERAVSMTDRPIERARHYAMMGQVHIWDSFRTGAALEQVERGLRAIGASQPGTRVGRIVSAIRAVVAGWFIEKTGLGFGTASGEQRERFIVLSRLLKLAGHARYWMMQPQEVVLLLAQILYPSNRLGEGPELVYCHTATALMMSAAGQGRISKRAGRRAIEIARRLEDPALESYARMNRAIALNVLGDVLDSEREMREVLSANAGWLDHGEYTQGIADISWNLQLRGYAKEAKRWVDRGLTSERQAEHQQGQIFMPSRAAICLVTRGMVDAARRYLRQASRIAEAAPGDTYRQGNYLSHLAFFHLEQGHLDDASVAVDSYRQLALIPKRTPFHMRNMYVFQAYLRLFEAERAGHVTDQLRLARSELASVCSSGHPVLNAHLQVISGGESRLADEEDAALDALESALRLAHRADAPWPAFEAQVQRAALLRHQGHINSADRLARSAYDEALERGWVLRARRVRRRFSQLAHGSHSMVRNEREIETDEAQLSARSVQLQRHVDALVQVSQVSLSVVDTDSQARAILDEVVSLFGAERAFLFLRTEDPDADELRLFAARNSIRSDLRDASGYSTQVLERVLGLREPVVVSGNEDAIAIGSESAIALNLRSIIAAPLMIRDRLVGTVYLDNRLAKGVFTRDDAETLTAISSHIAIALETSRTAKLELEYKSEREKRALAEALRSLTDHTSPMTHDTQIVMRLLESMQDFVPARRIDCYMLRDRRWKWVSCKLRGFATRLIENGEGSPVETTELLETIRKTGEPHLVQINSRAPVDSLPQVGPKTKVWLGVPMYGSETVKAVLAFESETVGGLHEGHIELAETFAGQAGIAVDNIHLFNRVQQLATVDELTGVSNRRALFATARDEFRRSKRYDQTMALIMLDVDHFKPINDTHGHGVGDVVLRELARRCERCARDVDEIGRYGGEEFALVAPFTSADAALTLAERMREAVAREPFLTSVGALDVTISLGVAEIQDGDESVEDVFERADSALYRAKRTGRNRVER